MLCILEKQEIMKTYQEIEYRGIAGVHEKNAKYKSILFNLNKYEKKPL